MKISREMLNSIDFEFKNGIMLDFWQEWYQFFDVKSFNWCDITFIKAQFETDRQCGDYEFTFVCLGLGVRLRIPHETEKSKAFYKEMSRSINTIKSWKSIWIERRAIDTLKRGISGHYTAIYSKRPRKFKEYKRCHLQIGD
jgi:hypothetical protein